MGVIDSPAVPVAYRERDQRPTGPVQRGVEVWPRHPERAHVFWDKDYASALKQAKEAGYTI